MEVCNVQCCAIFLLVCWLFFYIVSTWPKIPFYRKSHNQFCDLRHIHHPDHLATFLCVENGLCLNSWRTIPLNTKPKWTCLNSLKVSHLLIKCGFFQFLTWRSWSPHAGAEVMGMLGVRVVQVTRDCRPTPGPNVNHYWWTGWSC